jgi:hypothetical protein
MPIHGDWTTMTTRTAMTAADLFVLLDREFRRRKARDCKTCFVQLPYRVDMLEGGSTNWEVVVPLNCAMGCDAMLEEIVAELQERYELQAIS